MFGTPRSLIPPRPAHTRAAVQVRLVVSGSMRPRLLALLALAALTAALLAGCGGGTGETRPAPPAEEFPQGKGGKTSQLLHSSGATPSKLVIAPASEVFDTGAERYPFGVFT